MTSPGPDMRAAPAAGGSSPARPDRRTSEGTARHPQGAGKEQPMTSEPDQIRGEIQQTHRELSADVGALTEKLSPPRMVQRRARRTRAAMTNAKDKIMGSTASHTSAARDTMSPATSGPGGTVSPTAAAPTDQGAPAP